MIRNEFDNVFFFFLVPVGFLYVLVFVVSALIFFSKDILASLLTKESDLHRSTTADNSTIKLFFDSVNNNTLDQPDLP